MRVVRIGNGVFPEGAIGEEFLALRPLSLAMSTTMFDMMIATRSSASHDTLTKLIGRDNLFDLDVQLQKPIKLDDARSAIRFLPGHAENVARNSFSAFENFVESNATGRPQYRSGGNETLSLQSTYLDPRSTDTKIVYKAKLRIILTNESAQRIHAYAPSWLTGRDDVPVQFPLGYRYQIEMSSGSWKQDKWSQQEHESLQIEAGSSFRTYVGLDQSIPHPELEKRRATKRLGTLIIPIQVGPEERTLTFKV